MKCGDPCIFYTQEPDSIKTYISIRNAWGNAGNRGKGSQTHRGFDRPPAALRNYRFRLRSPSYEAALTAVLDYSYTCFQRGIRK